MLAKIYFFLYISAFAITILDLFSRLYLASFGIMLPSQLQIFKASYENELNTFIGQIPIPLLSAIRDV
jgi:hypothetical protein